MVNVHAFPENEIIGLKAEAVWTALETRYSLKLSSHEHDYLFARFVLGLTLPFYNEDNPAIHIEACHSILSLKLSPDRIKNAMHFVPAESNAWLRKAAQSIELLGGKHAANLLEQGIAFPASVDNSEIITIVANGQKTGE
ncbi:hypothetical protein [Brucella sp. LJL56]